MGAKRWTESEAKTLLDYVVELGQQEGIEKFEKETGRTHDSVRKKLYRLQETIELSDDDEDVLNEVVTDPRFSEDGYDEEPNFIKRFWRWITFQY